jgi:hypothetical protein
MSKCRRFPLRRTLAPRACFQTIISPPALWWLSRGDIALVPETALQAFLYAIFSSADGRRHEQWN